MDDNTLYYKRAHRLIDVASYKADVYCTVSLHRAQLAKDCYTFFLRMYTTMFEDRVIDYLFLEESSIPDGCSQIEQAVGFAERYLADTPGSGFNNDIDALVSSFVETKTQTGELAWKEEPVENDA